MCAQLPQFCGLRAQQGARAHQDRLRLRQRRLRGRGEARADDVEVRGQVGRGGPPPAAAPPHRRNLVPPQRLESLAVCTKAGGYAFLTTPDQKPRAVWLREAQRSEHRREADPATTHFLPPNGTVASLCFQRRPQPAHAWRGCVRRITHMYVHALGSISGGLWTAAVHLQREAVPDGRATQRRAGAAHSAAPGPRPKVPAAAVPPPPRPALMQRPPCCAGIAC